MTRTGRKFAKLLTAQSASRAAALAASLPSSILALRRFQTQAKAKGRSLRLVVLPERMGDVIAAEPIARRLRETTDDYLVWVIGKAFEDLVKFNPNLDGWLTITSYTEWMALDALFPGIAKTRLYVDRIHCSWFGGPDLRNPNPFGIDMASYYRHGSLLQVFSLLGLGERLDERPKVWPDPDFTVEGWIREAGLAYGFVAVHPGGSTHASRLWPKDRFDALAKRLWLEKGLISVELGLDAVMEEHPWIRRLGGAWPLSRQAALMARAQSFIGGDSGFAHMANALALPSAILLAPYRDFGQIEPFSGPWKRGEGVALLRAGASLEEIGVDAVFAALNR